MSQLAVAANWVLVVTGSVGAGVRGQEVERLGVMRSARDSGGDQSEASIPLSDQSETSTDNSLICSSREEKDNGERKHSLFHAVPGYPVLC